MEPVQKGLEEELAEWIPSHFRGHYMSGMGQYKGKFWGMHIHSQAILDLILNENHSQKMHLS
jgi:hypothetical protein